MTLIRLMDQVDPVRPGGLTTLTVPTRSRLRRRPTSPFAQATARVAVAMTRITAAVDITPAVGAITAELQPQPPPAYDNGGYGEPYTSPKAEQYEPVPPPSEGGPADGDSGRYYSQSEIVKAGHGFFGAVSKELGEAVEWAFQKAGRPNGYILGEDAGGALIAGLRYGEGTLYTKDAGNHKVYWQGPTLGYDVGAEGSKVMVLVYNLRDPSEIYDRFGGIQGAAYFVGGVGVQLQSPEA